MIWRTCERLGLRPPGLEAIEAFDQLAPFMQVVVLAYEQVRSYDEDLEARA